MKIVTVIQSRMGSTRLSGKAMIEICGKSSLQHVLDRLKPSKLIQDIYLATTVNPDNDILESWAEKNGIKCFRGSETDVLNSYYQIAKKENADAVIRITGDCPLIDCAIVDEVIKLFKSGSFDCVTNTIPPTFPDGLDVEIFSFRAIEEAWKNTQTDFEREHINVYIYQNPGLFKIEKYSNPVDLSRYRWTLDTDEDLEFLKRLITACDKKNYCHLNDILAVLEEHPDWENINNKHQRNQGYKIGY